MEGSSALATLTEQKLLARHFVLRFVPCSLQQPTESPNGEGI